MLHRRGARHHLALDRRGQEEPVAPDDRRGVAPTGNLRLPDHVLNPGPFRWKSGLTRNPLTAWAAPLGPADGLGANGGRREHNAEGGDGAFHGSVSSFGWWAALTTRAAIITGRSHAPSKRRSRL